MTLYAVPPSGGEYVETTGLLVSSGGSWVPVSSLYASEGGAWLPVSLGAVAPPTRLSELRDTFDSGALASFWLPPETTGSALPPVVDGEATFGTIPAPDSETLLSPPLLADSATVAVSLEWNATENYAPLDGVQVYFAGSWLWWSPYVDPSRWLAVDLATPLVPVGMRQKILLRFTRVVAEPPSDILEYSVDDGATWLPSLSPLPPPEPTEIPPPDGALSIGTTRGDPLLAGPFTARLDWVNR